MDLLETPKKPEFALHVAEIIGVLSNPNSAGAIDLRLASDSSAPVTSVYTPADDTFPPWYAANVGNLSVLFVGGCSVLGHATSTIDGYRGDLISPIQEPVNGYFHILATFIFDTVRLQGYLNSPNNLLVGHSMGGALCEHIAARLVNLNMGSTVRVCTFGAPKPGGLSFAGIVNQVERARWFTSDDPVPLLPPTPDLLPSLLLANNVLALARFANFVHPAGGIQITPAAELQKRTLPENASINASASLAGWLLAVDGSSSSGHHISTYVTRLGHWMHLHPEPNQPLPETAPTEVAGELPAVSMKQLRKNVTTDLADLSRAQNSETVAIPPNAGFKYLRIGRSHLVTFNGTAIAVTSRERSARSLTKHANGWLRSLQKQAVVMSDELAAQFVQYLQTAQTPGAGFTPVLNTRLPSDPS